METSINADAGSGLKYERWWRNSLISTPVALLVSFGLGAFLIGVALLR